ncbi:MAG: TRAP transporter substrate-binding protein [gamma proteobacterium symbiont of Ctena orbiculata]|nr:TRAP transporter substrate-binding protein [Candidatus Thiodiazotropha taylori]MBT3058282.1 TRAP transporter substrate-binding protein [Candidatus Thiodiazotropha sp. (ex Lucina pensylvanica)]MBV2093916.1 TRAP transporter substrate-binding protein [Candidatus Thiodiazotropha sp. (ex Codakia orbicularis)]PUB74478.1 MAG: ABC transporter substrate-binding protein [gamma proteobacterium symbiont of Ctena orbiculata]MBT3062885.1 TRAP transporter substrate-binding protein [Candidatus Thiodiazotrop
MKRRDFIKHAGGGTLALGAGMAGLKVAEAKDQIKWKMVTTWPKNFPGLGTGANKLAEVINEMSGGRMHVKVYGAKELVPAFEVFDAVSRGTAEIGHGAAYYWKGKSETAQFFSTVPFGMTAQEMNGWLYFGGGQELWQELYKPFGLIPAPGGNTGMQMGGWFNKEINSVGDLKGLKMRIPGLGGEVLKRAGGTPVNLPGGELFTSLQSGAIDATEWVNPYNDLAFGLFKAAKYYYYPGFHEPGTTLEAIINQKAYDALPKDLQAIVINACKIANQEMLAEYTARNPAALKTLVEKHKVDIRVYPKDVLETLRKYSTEVVEELAAKDKFAKKVYDSYMTFLKGSREWGAISDFAYLQARDKA